MKKIVCIVLMMAYVIVGTAISGFLTSETALAVSVSAITKRLEALGYPQVNREVANVNSDSEMDVKLMSKRSRQRSKVYTIQVAAYQKKSEAIMKMSEMQSHGYDAFWTQVKIKEQTWYRVNVGRFSVHSEAWNFHRKHSENQLVGSILRPLTRHEKSSKFKSHL